MMRPARIVALVIGCLLVVPGAALVLAGTILAVSYAVARDGDGYLEATIGDISSSTVAVTAEEVDFGAEPGTPDLALDLLDLDLRLSAIPVSPDAEVFVGIADADDLDAYLAGVAHDEISDIVDGRPVFRSRAGTASVDPPVDQDIWVASASGPGGRALTWTASGGRWAAVVMNADGSAGVDVDIDVGARSGAVFPLAFGMLGVGAVGLAVGVALIIAAAVGDGAAAPTGVGPVVAAPEAPDDRYPLGLEADLDPGLSRWMWLVKWFLAIPHYLVLFVLWVAFAVTTFVAGFAILLTGRYPRSLFEFNVGVLRWTWRVSYYAGGGGVGSDRYPAFSLRHQPGDLTRLDVAYPERLSRGLVLIKWWLLAIPHYLIVGILVGSGTWLAVDDGPVRIGLPGGEGMLGLVVLIAAVILLVTGTYPKALFDLIIGLNRWVYRVVVYVALMTDRYPPFRLDQGGTEQPPPPPFGGDDAGGSGSGAVPRDGFVEPAPVI